MVPHTGTGTSLCIERYRSVCHSTHTHTHTTHARTHPRTHTHTHTHTTHTILLANKPKKHTRRGHPPIDINQHFSARDHGTVPYRSVATLPHTHTHVRRTHPRTHTHTHNTHTILLANKPKKHTRRGHPPIDINQHFSARDHGTVPYRFAIP